MMANLYAIRVSEHQIVAAEVDASVAAESLAAGRPLLLATAAELIRLARRQGKSLVVFSQQASATPASQRSSWEARGALADARRAGARETGIRGVAPRSSRPSQPVSEDAASRPSVARVA